MVDSLRTEVFFQRLEAEHRGWLSSFDPVYLKNWEKLAGGDEEAALAEARIRQLLQGHGVTVEPNESLTGQGRRPDFCCRVKEYKFYVEVACIPISVATEKTGIPNGPHGFCSRRPLNDAIFSKCQAKAAQCKNLDAPALVAIGTFHSFAAMSSFKKPMLNWTLTGETKIAWDIDLQTGQQTEDAYEITELHSSAFLCPDEAEEVGYARSSISGLLFSGLTLGKRPLIGVLHPNPARSFEPATLPHIEFGRLVVDRSSRQLRVDWPEEESSAT